MNNHTLNLSGNEAMRDRALDHLSPLFSNPKQARRHLLELPIQQTNASPHGWIWLEVPDWANWVVPEKLGALFLPKFSEYHHFEEYPWWRAIDFYIGLEGEILRELRSGPIHSNSKILGKDFSSAFDFAWVNRIGAFLTAWCAQRAKMDIQEMFGDLPTPKVTLTHDVDALEMTLPLKVKQAVSRSLSAQFMTAIRILLSRRDPKFLKTLLDLEESFGYQSVWLLYVKPSKDDFYKRHPLDPDYSLNHDFVSWLITELQAKGHEIGVHTSFSSWHSTRVLQHERQTLAKKLGLNPNRVRQHWLRFGSTTTWQAQSDSGFSIDYTLGFNDRSGFRASTALPLLQNAGKLSSIPTIIMDSNLFNWEFRSMNSRKDLIDQVLDEVEHFGGHIAINWHPHTLGDAYGWAETYKYLLSALRSRKLEVVL